MISEQDLLLGRIALCNQFISQKQLDECISLQESAPEHKPLGSIMLEKRYINQEQLDKILAIQKERLQARDEYTNRIKSDYLFGRLLIQKGMATEKQVYEALREQAKLEEEGIVKQLGQIMVQKGFITVAQAKQILAEQDKQILQCTGCKTRYNVAGYTPDKQIMCPKCNEPLMLPRVTSAIGTAATLRSDGTTESLIGKMIGGCKILEKIGRGGMATVYKGHHIGLNKLMAVKVLPPEASTNRDLIRRFIAEARAAARLEHKNIVKVYDVGVEQNCVFIIMEYIDGCGLEKLLARNKFLDLRECIRIIMEAARGLRAAHKAGIIHRDIKPDNILISRTGQVKVSDFGLARSIRPLTAPEDEDILFGTPCYMSPEQVQGKEVDARSDIYSLGATFYVMLTRKKPFEGTSIYEIMKKHVSEPLKSPKEHNQNLPEDLCCIVMKMMAKDPAQRYQNMDELLEDLDRFRKGLKPAAAVNKGKSKQCPFCAEFNESGASRCSACGTSIEEERELILKPFENEMNCPKCKDIMMKGSRRCPKCGAIICSMCESRVATSGDVCNVCGQYRLPMAEQSLASQSPKRAPGQSQPVITQQKKPSPESVRPQGAVAPDSHARPPSTGFRRLGSKG